MALLGRVTDDDLAFRLQLQECNLVDIYLADRSMAQSHSRAVFNDRKILAHEISAVRQVFTDRELARQFEQEDHLMDDSGGQHVLHKNGSASDEDDAEDEEFSITCVACTEDAVWFDILAAPCNHQYCRDCVTELFQASMTDESLYPPRCCRQVIPLEDAKLVLHPKLVRDFEHKSIELDTKDRTYCFDPRCSTFISIDHITDNIASCADCGRRTCAICKVAAHLGDCPRDEALQEFLQTADDQGWQRCYSCRRVVDLRTGCNHITCPCGAHFCYVCGASWVPRTCDCPQWDEERLQERAEQIANRDPHHRLYHPPQGALDPGVDAAAAIPAEALIIPDDVVLEAGQNVEPDPIVHPPAPDARPDIPQADQPPPPPPPLPPMQPPRIAFRPAPLLRPVGQPPPPIVQPAARPHVRPTAIAAARAALMRVQRAEQLASPARPDYDHLVNAIRGRLEQNHECDHERWVCRREPCRCEECNHHLQYYIFECRQCHIRACQRCRRNRL
ncbi:hypothetical protein D6C76_05356 [Aureobasidium pullulans]|nr:hypothetical protein D6C76_05356 [Aureobasidium pullulans]